MRASCARGLAWVALFQCAAEFTSATRASTRSLAIHIEPANDKQIYKKDGEPDACLVTVSLTNSGHSPVLAVRWNTPFSGAHWPEGDFFRFPDTGDVVYVGPVVDHGPASMRAGDVIELAPSGSVSTVVDLCRDYSFTTAGPLSLHAEFAVLVLASDDDTVAKRLAEGQVQQRDAEDAIVLVSQPLHVNVDQAMVERSVRASQQFKSMATVGRSLQSQVCSPDQLRLIQQAKEDAKELLVEALKELPGGPHYTLYRDDLDHWLGESGIGTLISDTHIANRFSRMLEAIDHVSFVCGRVGCGAFTYAFVFPNDINHKTIHLCSEFWRAPLYGFHRDSQAGTLVHELSHFVDIAATQDFAYGSVQIRNLAKRNVNQARSNADNYEAFAETRFGEHFPVPIGEVCAREQETCSCRGWVSFGSGHTFVRTMSDSAVLCVAESFPPLETGFARECRCDPSDTEVQLHETQVRLLFPHIDVHAVVSPVDGTLHPEEELGQAGTIVERIQVPNGGFEFYPLAREHLLAMSATTSLGVEQVVDTWAIVAHHEFQCIRAYSSGFYLGFDDETHHGGLYAECNQQTDMRFEPAKTPSPTRSPTISPTTMPSQHPSYSPSASPSRSPTLFPTGIPSSPTPFPSDTVAETTSPTVSGIATDHASKGTQSPAPENLPAAGDSLRSSSMMAACSVAVCLHMWAWGLLQTWPL